LSSINEGDAESVSSGESKDSNWTIKRVPLQVKNMNTSQLCQKFQIACPCVFDGGKIYY
jgi:hypothetical protein